MITEMIKDTIRIDLSLDPRPEIPRTRGVYCFWTPDGDAAYVGKAAGKNGLRGRILLQHLNPVYLEPREKVWSRNDQAQAAKNVMRNGKTVIEKSMFRKHLARRHDLAPGTECLSYLLNKFFVSYVEMPDATGAEIKNAETLLIRDLKPSYNG